METDLDEDGAGTKSGVETCRTPVRRSVRGEANGGAPELIGIDPLDPRLAQLFNFPEARESIDHIRPDAHRTAPSPGEEHSSTRANPLADPFPPATE
jgi:hypothetical protein